MLLNNEDEITNKYTDSWNYVCPNKEYENVKELANITIIET